MSRAKVPVDLFASVGGGEQVHLGTVFAPVVSKQGVEQGIFIDLSHQITVMRNRLEFFDPTDEAAE